MPLDPLDPIFELTRRNPGLRQVFRILLDRQQRSGRLPQSLTLAVDAETRAGLQSAFSARFVPAGGAGRVRIDLGGYLRASGQAPEALLHRLRAALGTEEAPAIPQRVLRQELERGFSELAAAARRDVTRAFFAARLRELGDPDSDWVERAERSGAAQAIELARRVSCCLDALPVAAGPVRIQNFGARVLGSSKALRAGSELQRAVASALLDHDAWTRRALEEQGVPPRRSAELAFALDVNGVSQDELAASVLCFGPIQYEKRGQCFDHVARHTAFGESSRLITHQLRDASFSNPGARRLTVFENLAPYLDYVDACIERGRSDEIVLCSAGQASWAVVLLLSGLARFGLEMRHSGDLDRAGVMILRSLRQRSGARLVPLCMDAETHARFAARGQPVSGEERRRLEQRLAGDAGDALGHDLLRAIAQSGVWVEQEQFAEECLEQLLG